MLRSSEALVVATAVGMAATFAAPWVELQGTFQSWRIVEWHTFWRGANAFQLTNVVATGFHVPVEFATEASRTTIQALEMLGLILGGWHLLVLAVLLVIGAKNRSRQRTTLLHVVVEFAAIVAILGLTLYGLAFLLALPSSLTLKVDFRTPADIHTDSLIWSNATLMPLAPVVSVLAALTSVQFLFIRRMDAKTSF